ncbi:MAG TPA: phosphoribosyltransferase family protein [Acidimicrobiia bacterium]|nr:phosphoribosyltransferase family protein [Acidimicrobiia bacterium]
MERYRNRTEAGNVLAGLLSDHAGEDALVLGIPRGGLPVARPIAEALDAELGVVVAGKVGAPGNPEFAIGAVAPDGVTLIDEITVRRLGISRPQLEMAVERAIEKLRGRQEAYGATDLQVADRTVIVVDDGVATGATLQAALQYLRRLEPETLICAIPVGPPATVARLAADVDEMVCPRQPDHFRAVGEWYQEFSQVSDREVEALLSGA